MSAPARPIAQDLEGGARLPFRASFDSDHETNELRDAAIDRAALRVGQYVNRVGFRAS